MRSTQKLNNAIINGEFVDLGAAGGIYVCNHRGSAVDLGKKSAVITYLKMLQTRPLSAVAPRVPGNLRSSFAGCLHKLMAAGLLDAPYSKGNFGVLGSRLLAQMLILSLSEKASIIYTDFDLRNLRVAPQARLISVSTWQNIVNHEIDLVLIATETVEADHAVLDFLRLSEVPYLLVKSHQGKAVVGPLVAGRNDPCQKCRDLALSDRQPSWPKLIWSLANRTSVPLPATTSWAVSMATMYADWFSNTGRNDLAGSALELTGTDLQRRVWNPHRDCPCGTRENNKPGRASLRIAA